MTGQEQHGWKKNDALDSGTYRLETYKMRIGMKYWIESLNMRQGRVDNWAGKKM